MATDLTSRLAGRLAALRAERNLTLDGLAEASGVSRAALSRIENAEVSPTAEQIGRLCAAYGISLTRLMVRIEDGFPALVARDDQPVLRDKDSGLIRRIVSASGPALAGEVVECKLDPEVTVLSPAPEVPGQEHHLLVLSGKLRVELEETPYDLNAGDTLRYRPTGPVRLSTRKAKAAKYLLFRVSA